MFLNVRMATLLADWQKNAVLTALVKSLGLRYYVTTCTHASIHYQHALREE